VSVAGSEGPYLEESALVAQKRAAAESPPTAVHLIGYLGRDPDAGFWRVYFNERLDSYVRVPEGSITGNRTHTRDEGPQARTVVTVAASEDLNLVNVAPQELQASFLRGEFVTKLSPGMAVPSPGAATFGTSLPCGLVVISIIAYTAEQTPGPPPFTSADSSNASCCLCWTPESTCPFDPSG
jgi:hypothetical protein